MWTEEIKNNFGEAMRFNMKVSFEGFIRPLKAYYFFALRDSKNRVKDKRCYGNLVVNSASILVARLLKDKDAVSAGINYLAVGTGNFPDPQNPPAPLPTEEKLIAEVDRKVFSEKHFINSDGVETLTPTNVVDYCVIFAETEGNGPLTELGMFGDATGVKDSGTLINKIHFPVLNKLPGSTLELVIRLTT